MASYLEHIQYVTHDLDRLVEFYAYVFDWRLRGRGIEEAADRSYDWVHIGTDDSYVAFRTPYREGEDVGERPHDHFGIVVDDMQRVIGRLDQLGRDHLRKGSHPFRERIYTRDPDGNEIEIIHYLSAEAGERNDYAIDARLAAKRLAGGVESA